MASEVEEALIPVKAEPSPENAVAVTVPDTSNFDEGVVVPIPTFPVDPSITNLSAPPVWSYIKKSPAPLVLAEPELAIDQFLPPVSVL